MSCGKYLELLSARMDGALTEPEERALEAHLKSCPDCRAAEAQLAALRPAFAELEDFPAPEGLARDVMDRIRETEPHKTIPPLLRPRFKVLAGLVACAVLAVGLYSAVRQPRQDLDLTLRGLSQDASGEDADIPAGEILRSVPDFSMTAAGSDTDTPAEEKERLFPETRMAAPDEYKVAVYDGTAALSGDAKSFTDVLVIDRMPEGGWELVLPDACGSVDGLYVTGELLEQIQRLAQEQNITASLTSGTEEALLHLIVVLDKSE